MALNEAALPARKHPAHGVLYIPHRPTIIFDTVCTKGRQRWLANDAVHQQLRSVWPSAKAWVLGRYVIMPDHIHFFAAATESPIDYDSWVTYWKSQFSKKHGDSSHRWLTGHWDTRMRTLEQYEEKWNYVRQNPVRHGLADHSDDWSYQGEVYRIEWE